jgi:hypothetical protein
MGTTNYTSSIKVNNLMYQGTICKSKMEAGSLDGKKPIRVDDRTTVYVRITKTIKECLKIKQKYINHLNKLL